MSLSLLKLERWRPGDQYAAGLRGATVTSASSRVRASRREARTIAPALAHVFDTGRPRRVVGPAEVHPVECGDECNFGKTESLTEMLARQPREDRVDSLHLAPLERRRHAPIIT